MTGNTLLYRFVLSLLFLSIEWREDFFILLLKVDFVYQWTYKVCFISVYGN